MEVEILALVGITMRLSFSDLCLRLDENDSGSPAAWKFPFGYNPGISYMNDTQRASPSALRSQLHNLEAFHLLSHFFMRFIANSRKENAL